MAIISDFFIAAAEEAAAYQRNSLPDSDVAYYGQITEMELGGLMAILHGEEWDPEIDYATEYGFDIIHEWDAGQRILIHIPGTFLQDLIEIRDAELSEIADIWSATPEIQCYGEELEPVLRDLKRLAQSALSANKQLYLCNMF